MPTVDFLPVATAVGANVDSQAAFAGSGYQEDGFQVGIAQPAEANKIWRQSSMIGAAVANFIANVLGVDVLDDGNLSVLITNLTDAIESVAGGGGSAPQVIAIASIPAPNLDFTVGNRLMPVFEITLTSNTIPTFSHVTPGQLVSFIIHQDPTGGWTWAWPGACVQFGDIDPAASSTSVQTGVVGADGAVRAISGLVG